MNSKECSSICKRLLPRLSGFVAKGRMLFKAPLDHTLRAIYLDGSSNPRAFYVQVFLQALCVPREHVMFNIGWRLGRNSWDADAPGLVEELRSRLEQEALPFLLRVRTPRDMADAACSVNVHGPIPDPVVNYCSPDTRTQEALAYALAGAGEIELAVQAIDCLIASVPERPPVPRWMVEMADQASSLRKLLLTDPAGARKQLDAWEAETVRNLGLEQYRQSGALGHAL
jgi:hypothetical protein